MGGGGPHTPELSNRGRSLLGAPPTRDPTPPAVKQPSAPVQPSPPNTQQLEGQVASLQASIKSLKEQVNQSESNLTAQWSVLQQGRDSRAAQAVEEAREAVLEDLSRSCNVSLSILETVLQPIIESCTKDSISSGKSWIFQHATTSTSNQLIAEYLVWRVTKESVPFNQRLHLIYLVNDVLHHCVRKNAEALKTALESVAVPMYCATAEVAGEDEIKKLTKLITLWESKNKFFADDALEEMKDPLVSIKKYRAGLVDKFSDAADTAEKNTMTTYEGYKEQHEQFVNHAQGNIEQQQHQLEGLQHQIQELEDNYEQEMKAWQSASGQAAASRRSRWDRTAPHSSSSSSAPPPGMIDMTKPPPGFPQPTMEPTTPTVPYFELPAGLMVPLIRLEDNTYKPLDPTLIKLPPPQPPNDRLLAAVDLFYSPPSHDRPRDPEGWEKLSLYEWFREKQDAVKRKEDDIKDGVRPRSPTVSPDRTSRDSTPEETEKERRPRERKRYRSRSRTKTRSRSGGSRGSTPTREIGRAHV